MSYPPRPSDSYGGLLHGRPAGSTAPTPPPATTDEPSRAMAGWALGLAVVPCFGASGLVAIGLAIAVLARSKDGRNHGTGMAIAALVIAPLWILGALLAAGPSLVDTDQDVRRDSDGHAAASGDASVLKIRVGDCFDQDDLFGSTSESEPVQASAAHVVPCIEPHQFETYAVVTVPGTVYPGEEQVSRYVARRCLRRFRAFIGTDFGHSRLEPYVMYPQPDSWRLLHDREGTCMVGQPGHLTSGSLARSRQ